MKFPTGITFIFLVTIFLATFSISWSVTTNDLAWQSTLRQADRLIIEHRYFEAEDAILAALQNTDVNNTILHTRLAALYYDIGLIDKAIIEAEKAVSMAPEKRWNRFNLAKYYLADRQYQKAEQLLYRLLQSDPGFTIGYSYLAEVLIREKEYGKALICYQRAKNLGYRGKQLAIELAKFTNKDVENVHDVSQPSGIYRFITFTSMLEAKTALSKLTKGYLFESLELPSNTQPNDEIVAGVINEQELRQLGAMISSGDTPFSKPIIVTTGKDYRLIQCIAPFELSSLYPLPSNKYPTNALDEEPRLQAKNSNIQVSSGSVAPFATDPEPKIIKENLSKQPVILSAQEHLTLQLSAFHFLESWKNAWQAADIKRYLAHYSDKFIPPDGGSLTAWKRKREKNLARPKFIRIAILNPVITPLNQEKLSVTFQQNYESDIVQDLVDKTLTIEKEKDSWKIVEENTTQRQSL